MDARTSPLAP